MADLPPGLMLQLAAMLTGGKDTPVGGQTFGGATFGGNRYGGNTYGGNTFGGGKFGASAPPDGVRPLPPFGPIPPSQGQPVGRPDDSVPYPRVIDGTLLSNSAPSSAGMVPADVVANTQPPANIPTMPPVTVTAQGPTAGPPVEQPVPVPPVDVPPMPAPAPIGNGSVRGDMASAAQQLLAQKKITPDQFAEMFPQWAGGSLTQTRGG